MNRTLRISPLRRRLATAALGFAILAPLALSANAAHANQLKSVQATPLGGQRVQIDLTLAQPAPKPLSFSIDKPARIAVDLPNTELALKQTSHKIDIAGVRKVMTAAAGGRTRVVVDLSYPMPYTTRVSGRHVYITIGGSGTRTASSFGPASGETNAPAAQGSRVTHVDFRRGENGSGRVLIQLSDPHTNTDVQKEGDEVVVSLKNTMLPKKDMRRLDVSDFATPVTAIDATRHGDNTRVVIHTQGNYEQIAYQSDNLLTVEIKPVNEQQQARASEKQYTGKRLNLNFQNVSVRAVLAVLADFTGLNMVVSDSVNGDITLRLHNVPWDQALDIILKTRGLAMRKHGNVVLIAPAAQLAKQEQAQLASKQAIQKLLPLEFAFIQVNYAKASDLANLIKSQGNSLLSKRGSVTVDKRTNTLLVQDTADRLAEVRKMVHKLDIPVRQVLIQSRIVIVNKDFTQELGVRFGDTAVHPTQDGLVTVSGSAEGTDTIINSAVGNLNSTGQVTPVGLPSLNNRLAVNAPAAGPVGQLAVSILSSNYLVDLELSALQAEGHGQVISRPHVITSNQHEALIKQGVEIPYQQASSSGATNVQFKDAVLSLKVTPQITPDNKIIMDLDVSKDSKGETVPSATGGTVPSIDTREVKTQVLVNNGDTVVLGGIYETSRTQSVHKVPLLGDIPLLGFLFRDTQTINNKKELLIFVTPKIISSGAQID
ncbi:MAG TPA: type IV pilus secretin PilQ, partial [Gammaproteobacteria bacterium]|nr:type IV pilus secretin PilQ [Gammaproteobacteria bacterium]